MYKCIPFLCLGDYQVNVNNNKIEKIQWNCKCATFKSFLGFLFSVGMFLVQEVDVQKFGSATTAQFPSDYIDLLAKLTAAYSVLLNASKIMNRYGTKHNYNSRLPLIYIYIYIPCKICRQSKYVEWMHLYEVIKCWVLFIVDLKSSPRYVGIQQSGII